MGLGDIGSFARIVNGVRAELKNSNKNFIFFNGLPTAEATMPSYQAIGVKLYSSAAFVSRLKLLKHSTTAMSNSNQPLVDALLRSFYFPLVELRSQVPDMPFPD